MAIFTTEYVINTHLKLDDAKEVFSKNFDEMAKKGYTHDIRFAAENSDHYGKDFSGDIIDGVYKVRQTEDLTDKFYRYLPLYRITFSEKSGEAKLIVKGTASAMRFGFCAALVMFVFFFCITIIMGKDLILPMVVIDVVLAVVCCVFSVSGRCQFKKTRETLEYMYK